MHLNGALEGLAAYVGHHIQVIPNVVYVRASLINILNVNARREHFLISEPVDKRLGLSFKLENTQHGVQVLLSVHGRIANTLVQILHFEHLALNCLLVDVLAALKFCALLNQRVQELALILQVV
ncbi:hypothetical protein BpHYR1_005136 [Brachionus plicatilis]|uniref:Uncharacterized protein n=1 Tax=Brachionus plicatilis TaxID=10195 RepID=A0A3M7SPR8_BRAPC|nr:hypothetical protein BpHYR1_005136 [Brachionus plicatilis]